MLIVRPDGTLYLVELTVCYETNMPKNDQIKPNRYKTTIEHLKSSFTCVKFVSLVVSALGIFYKDSKTLITMFADIKITRQGTCLHHQKNQQYSHKNIVLYILHER